MTSHLRPFIPLPDCTDQDPGFDYVTILQAKTMAAVIKTGGEPNWSVAWPSQPGAEMELLDHRNTQYYAIDSEGEMTERGTVTHVDFQKSTPRDAA